MNFAVQAKVLNQAEELGATCLASKPVWVSIRFWRDSFQSPYAQALADTEILHWSYRKQGFFPAYTISRSNSG